MTEAGLCWWGAVDIDLYTLDLAGMVVLLKNAHIPAFVCRSKSGGAHVFLFFSEPIPAGDVIAKLRELAAFLGHGAAEIFPKQSIVSASGLGNWLAMPYFGGDATTQYAVTETGTGMSVHVFLKAAEACRLTAVALTALIIQRVVEGFSDGPPCLETLVATGFPPGTRNSGAMAMATLAKKKYPDTWREILPRWVQLYMPGTTPFPADELASIIKRLAHKTYNYQCKNQPICAVCNSGLCRTRPFGVGGGTGGSPIDSLSVFKTDPPSYYLTLRDPPVEVILTVDQLFDPRALQKQVWLQHHVFIPEYKHADWSDYLEAAGPKMISISAPAEAGIDGTFVELVGQFFADASHESRDDIAIGNAFHDDLTGDLWFRMRDLERFLGEHKFVAPPPGQRAWIAARMSKMAMKSHNIRIQGVQTRLLTVKAGQFDLQTALETPPPDGSPL